MKVKICVLKTAGTNCDEETAYAFNLAGGEAEIVHLNSLKESYDPVKRKTVRLADYHILALPGGFSHGDYISAGKVLAEELNKTLGMEIKKFIDDGKLIIGICNGFQVLVKMGLLPHFEERDSEEREETEKQTATLISNENKKFECRWIRLSQPNVNGRKCVWTKGIDKMDLPIAHGEGRFVADQTIINQLFKEGMVVFQYVDDAGNPTMNFPDNPNGSLQAIAGVCDHTGRVFGLMPHPERHILAENHPSFFINKIINQNNANNKLKDNSNEQWNNKLNNHLNYGMGLQIFKNGIDYASNNLLKETKVKDTAENLTYAQTGVSVDQGEKAAEKINGLLKSTWNEKVRPNVSGFKAIYELGDDYLVGATDGVGTKLLVGIAAEKVDTLGQDLVAMCVNDLVRVGAEPLFFVDYIAVGKLDLNGHHQILKGISEGCKIAGIPLLGGETAEMPGMYQHEHFDLAGFAIGKIKKTKIIDGTEINPEAVILGIESSGLHSNGYSLARNIFFERLKLNADNYIAELGKTAAEALLEPTFIYVKQILDLIETYPGKIKGMAHITGGGLPNKLSKVIPEGLTAEIKNDSWPIPKIFCYMAKNGPVDEKEMRNTFNMGIGMVLIVNDSKIVPEMIKRLENKHQLNSYVIGKIVKSKKVNYV